MPIVLGGNKPNLSYKEILELIIDLIKDNWLTDEPPINDPDEFKNVHFNTDWYDNAHDMEVSVILNTDVVGPAVIGNVAFDHGAFIEIHTFTRALDEHYPTIMSNINKEITRILYANVRGLKNNGISLVLPNNFRRIDEQDNTSTTWHSMTSVQLVFTKFVVPS